MLQQQFTRHLRIYIHRNNCRPARDRGPRRRGRLAKLRWGGRYHRDCFHCTACAQPFPSGEFYVLADQPFCGRHYHERNGSCCRGCRVGIEGAYLETDDGRMYHPACLRCDGCGCALAEEYWELEGKALWHRHNLGSPSAGGPAAGSGGAPQKHPERRRTKLVNGRGGGAGRRPFF